MNNKAVLYQWIYTVEGLIPSKVIFDGKIWLKEKEIALKSHNKKLYAYVLGTRHNSENCKEKLQHYLNFASLISDNISTVNFVQGNELKSISDLGERSNEAEINIIFEPYFSQSILQKIGEQAPLFLNYLASLESNYKEVVNKNKFTVNALSYFNESEQKGIYTEEGLISATIALESLLNEGNGDISYKLSLRASFLLGLVGFDPAQTFENFKKLYTYRSTVVHGGNSKRTLKIAHQIPSYIRALIKIFLIMLSNKERESCKIATVKAIDQALLNIDIRNALQKEIQDRWDEFSLGIPRKFEENKDGEHTQITAW